MSQHNRSMSTIFTDADGNIVSKDVSKQESEVSKQQDVAIDTVSISCYETMQYV